LAGGKSDPYFEVRKAHGAVMDEKGNVLLDAYSSPGDGYMGTKEPKSLIARSNIVKNCLDPEWFEVEIELGRYGLSDTLSRMELTILIFLKGCVMKEISQRRS
jgi:hypothetical protein